MRNTIRATFLGLLLVAISGAASASVISIIGLPIPVTGLNPSSLNGGFNPSGGAIAGFTATNGTIGTLYIDGPGTVTYTYLGREAGNTNYFFDLGGIPTATLLDILIRGATSTQTVLGAGILNFQFGTTAPGDQVTTVANGSATNSSPTFAIFNGGTSGFQYILGYDDKGGGTNLADRDFDDMVIGINVSSVPEPGTLTLLGLGLAGLGFARRKRV